jgi:subtilisin-like proprotein convertase family protein
MHRPTLRHFGSSLAWLLPLALACPSEATPANDTGATTDPVTGEETGSSDADTSGDTSTTMTPTTDPDTSATVDTSSSSEESSSSGGFVGCGDGDVDLQAGEVCDGDNLDGRDCLSEDFGGGILACNPDCTLDTSGCTYACGDDEVQGDEDCEGNDLDGGTCRSEGFDGGDLGCNPDCTYDLSGCENYICGDGIVAGPEVCDGMNLDGEDCESQGFDSGTLACAADCSALDDSNCFVCGDGIINGGEECDGAALGGETCVTQGADGGVLSCNSDCTFDVDECVGCGNDDQDPGEECDGPDFGGTTCALLGFVDGGQPTCLADCTISDLSCAGLHTFCASPNSAIGPNAGQTQSTIPVAGLVGEILDIDVQVDATHTRVGDLDIDVRHVDTNLATSLADDQCGNANDIDATFDQDAAAAPNCVEPIAIEGNVLPLGNLDAYVENEAVGAGNGTWELTIADQVANEGGTLASWCVEITTGNLDCPDGELDMGEHCDDLLAPDFVNASCTQCIWDFAQVPQLYCNGSCSWAGEVNGSCDQPDADIYCQLVTGDPSSTATSFDIVPALDEFGFSCPGIGTNLGPIPALGVDVDVWYQDTSILANHGAGEVVTNVVCD